MPLQAGRYPPSSTGTLMSSTGSAQISRGYCEVRLQQDPPPLQPPRLSRGRPTPPWTPCAVWDLSLKPCMARMQAHPVPELTAAWGCELSCRQHVVVTYGVISRSQLVRSRFIWQADLINLEPRLEDEGHYWLSGDCVMVYNTQCLQLLWRSFDRHKLHIWAAIVKWQMNPYER